MSTTQETELSDTARQRIADIRALLDFVETRPALAERIYTGSTFYVYAHTSEEFAALLRDLGTFDKSATDLFLNAERSFGTVKLEVTASRKLVCERVKVGEQPVTREVYPESVKPEIVTETEDVYEWVCPESWLS
jgi:hypothetical protein